MGWIEQLQDRVSSLYSNVSIVKTTDDKRVQELVNMLKEGMPLNILMGTPMQKIKIYEGIKTTIIEDGNEKVSLNDDDFAESPIIELINDANNTLLIISKILDLDKKMQQELLAIVRDTNLMAQNKHIIIFTEDTHGISNQLLQSSNIIDVPLSLPAERRQLLEQFKKSIASGVFEDEDAIIRATSGLNLIQFESLLYEGYIKFGLKKKENIPASWFAKKKVDILNAEEIFSLYTPKLGLDVFASPNVLRDYLYNRIIKVIVEYERAKKIGVRFPDGIFLFGMQGTGKTMFSRAIAKELNIPFVEFRASSIFSKYVGDSEKNVERMIKVLTEIQPAVLFIDEIDAIGMRRGNVDLDSGATRKVVNRLMSWLAEPDKEVLVIGSTNKPEQMDEAFIRNGRFSFKIPMLLPNFETREQIFQIHLNIREVKYDNIDFKELARRSNYYAGADIVKVIDEALYYVFISGRDTLTMEDFDEAFKDVIVNVEDNKKTQEMYVKLAEQYGSNRKIIDIYTKNFETYDKAEMLKKMVRGKI